MIPTFSGGGTKSPDEEWTPNSPGPTGSSLPLFESDLNMLSIRTCSRRPLAKEKAKHLFEILSQRKSRVALCFTHKSLFFRSPKSDQ